MADTNPIPMQSDPTQPDLPGGNEQDAAQQPGGNEPDGMQEQSQAEPGFPQFRKLPIEIQIQIFTEAIGKPNIQLLTNPKQQYVFNGTFTVSFHPDRKCQGISGYRRLVTLSLVNRTAYTAVRLATAKNTVRLPFKQLNNRIDGSLDLVFINLPAFPTPDKNCFHRDYRRPYSRWFNEERQADSFRGIQKVAFNYDNKAMILWSGHRIHCSVQSFFRCPDAGFLHYQHLSWKFCPDEFAAFLDCFPDLHEVSIVLDMPRRRSDDRIRLNNYITNYYTRKPPCPRPPSILPSRPTQPLANTDVCFPANSSQRLDPPPQPVRLPRQHHLVHRIQPRACVPLPQGSPRRTGHAREL